MSLFHPGMQPENSGRSNLIGSRHVYSWRLIEEVVLTGTAASVTFTAISGRYRSLVLIWHARTDRAGVDNEPIKWQANADAGNNYDHMNLQGTGAGVVTSGGALAATAAHFGEAAAATARANNFATGIGYWHGYAFTDREKHQVTTGRERFGSTAALANIMIGMHAGRWRNVAAITSLTILPDVGPNFIAGCRFSLYGIL